MRTLPGLPRGQHRARAQALPGRDTQESLATDATCPYCAVLPARPPGQAVLRVVRAESPWGARGASGGSCSLEKEQARVCPRERRARGQEGPEALGHQGEPESDGGFRPGHGDSLNKHGPLSPAPGTLTLVKRLRKPDGLCQPRAASASHAADTAVSVLGTPGHLFPNVPLQHSVLPGRCWRARAIGGCARPGRPRRGLAQALRAVPVDGLGEYFGSVSPRLALSFCFDLFVAQANREPRFDSGVGMVVVVSVPCVPWPPTVLSCPEDLVD